MVYKILIGYMNGEKTIEFTVQDVAEIFIEDGAHTFMDEDLQILFTAPSDSIIYVQRISFG